jgi:hypothetical protein
MPNPAIWICPGCGRPVALPAGDDEVAALVDAGRLDQLAQALCGCWVRSLNDSSIARLLRAVVSGDGLDSGFRGSDATPCAAVGTPMPRLRFSTR